MEPASLGGTGHQTRGGIVTGAITSVTDRSGRSGSGKVHFDDLELTTNSADGDPSTMKRFGFISAKPSEFLIVYRGGKLRRSVSGQGARCFKWPWDTVAIVPTTLKEVIFQANQITADNVDVRLRGVVMYRINDPLSIYKLINFSYRQRGEAKLARMIADMCRSTAKWLVANMGVEDCVRRRKEEIALALKSEVSAVVSSDCPEGWGVDIITIDIQDIYIQDAELFSSLQAKFKAEKRREAELATLQTKLEVERRSLETERALQQEQHQSDLEGARMAAARQREALDLRRKHEEEQSKLDTFRAEQKENLERYKVEQDQERERIRSEAARDRQLVDAESARVKSEESVRALREQLAVENTTGPASLERIFLTKALPTVAEAVAGSMSHSRFNVYQTSGGSDGHNGGGNATPFHFALMQLMELLQARTNGEGD